MQTVSDFNLKSVLFFCFFVIQRHLKHHFEGKSGKLDIRPEIFCFFCLSLYSSLNVNTPGVRGHFNLQTMIQKLWSLLEGCWVFKETVHMETESEKES